MANRITKITEQNYTIENTNLPGIFFRMRLSEHGNELVGQMPPTPSERDRFKHYASLVIFVNGCLNSNKEAIDAFCVPLSGAPSSQRS